MPCMWRVCAGRSVSLVVQRIWPSEVGGHPFACVGLGVATRRPQRVSLRKMRVFTRAHRAMRRRNWTAAGNARCSAAADAERERWTESANLKQIQTHNQHKIGGNIPLKQGRSDWSKLQYSKTAAMHSATSTSSTKAATNTDCQHPGHTRKRSRACFCELRWWRPTGEV